MDRRSYTRKELAKKASLTSKDLAQVQQCRRMYNRLGFGYQMGFVKLLNRFPLQRPFEILDELLLFAAIQLNLDPTEIELYKQRRQTISEHQERIRAYLNLRRFGPEEAHALETFLFKASSRLEQTSALLKQAEAFLAEHGVLLPAPSTLTRIIGEQRKRAREHIFGRIAAGLLGEVSETLDALLQIKGDEAVSGLQKIRENPSKPSAEAMVSLVEKLAAIEATGVLSVDLSWLNSNYQRALFHYVRSCSVDRLRALSQPRCKAALVCFLWQSYRDAVDQAVDMFDKLITRVHTQAENALDEQMRHQRRMIRTSLSTLKAVGDLILDESIADAELRQRLFLAISRQDLAAQVESLTEWVSGKKSDLFHEVVKHFGYLRRFTPQLLHALEFVQEVEGEVLPCLSALKTLKEMNVLNQRKLPMNAPTDFLSRRMQPMVEDGGQVNRRAWECALLVGLRDEIKSGNISVKHSKRFGRFDDFFIEEGNWQEVRGAFFRRSGLPDQARDVPAYLIRRLSQAYDRFLQAAPENSFATVDETGWHLSSDTTEKLTPEAQQGLDRLKGWLAQHMRKIKLPDLLIEVDNDLGFTQHFLPPAQRLERQAEDICAILATVMAHGCNLGLYTMAQLIQDITYRQLKRISDWQLTEEAQRMALAELVGAIAGLEYLAGLGGRENIRQRRTALLPAPKGAATDLQHPLQRFCPGVLLFRCRQLCPVLQHADRVHRSGRRLRPGRPAL